MNWVCREFNFSFTFHFIKHLSSRCGRADAQLRNDKISESSVWSFYSYIQKCKNDTKSLSASTLSSSLFFLLLQVKSFVDQHSEVTAKSCDCRRGSKGTRWRWWWWRWRRDFECETGRITLKDWQSEDWLDRLSPPPRPPTSPDLTCSRCQVGGVGSSRWAGQD